MSVDVAAVASVTVPFTVLDRAVKVAGLVVAGERGAVPMYVVVGDDRAHVVVAGFADQLVVELGECSGLDAGVFAVDVAVLKRTLAAAVKGLTAGQRRDSRVVLRVVDDHVLVSVDGYGVQIPTRTVTGEVEVPDVFPGTHVVERAELVGLLDVMALAADDGVMYPVLANAKLALGAETIEAWASDRYQLVHHSVPARGTTDVVGFVHAVRMLKILKACDAADVELAVDGEVTIVTAGEVTLRHAQTVDFPDIARVMQRPKSGMSITIDTDVIRAATARVAALTEKGHAARVDCEAGTGRVQLVPGTSAGTGTAPTLPASIEGSGGTPVGINPEYLHNALKMIEADQVMIETEGPAKPVHIRTEDGPHWVVMAMRLPS